MKNHLDNFNEIDTLIKATLQTDDKPSVELNLILKQRLIEKECELRALNNHKKLSLWYLPMLLNCLIFGVVGVAAYIFIGNYFINKIIIGICLNIIISGIILTFIGVRFTNLKSNMAIFKNRGGALA